MKEDEEDDVEIIAVDKEGDNEIKKMPAIKTELKMEDIFANTEEREDKWSLNGLPKNVEPNSLPDKLVLAHRLRYQNSSY